LFDERRFMGSVKKLPNVFYFRLGLLHSRADEIKHQAATRQKIIYCDFSRDFILFIYLFYFMRALDSHEVLQKLLSCERRGN
jgi:hypothetical protein